MRFIRGLALVALVALPATQASAQRVGKFKFKAGSTVSGWGVSVGTYKGELDGKALDIWCVDYLNHVGVGNKYNVYVTGLGIGSDVSKTRFGSLLGSDTYRKAVYLASKFSTSAHSDWKYIHAAIWSLTSPGIPNIVNASDVNKINAWLATATANYHHYYYNNAYVLSDVAISRCAVASPGTAPWLGCGHQEHIFIDGNLTATPEPMTMGLLAVGLVGVAGVGAVRRRKKKQ